MPSPIGWLAWNRSTPSPTAFQTVAIGGFSTHDASIGFFNSQAIELVAIFFIVLSGINFTLHFYAFRQRSLHPYRIDPECRTYLVILLITALIAWLILFTHNEHDARRVPALRPLRHRVHCHHHGI